MAICYLDSRAIRIFQYAQFRARAKGGGGEGKIPAFCARAWNCACGKIRRGLIIFFFFFFFTENSVTVIYMYMKYGDIYVCQKY